MACGPRRVGLGVEEAIFRHLKRWKKKRNTTGISDRVRVAAILLEIDANDLNNVFA